MKKTISIIMCLIVATCSFTITTSATSEQILKQKINEYDMYQLIIEKSDSELRDLGVSATDILYLRTFDYEDEIRERAKLSNEVLTTYGYTKKEIRDLKKAAELDTIPVSTMKVIATSTLTSYIKALNYGTVKENNQDVRYVDMEFKFEWKRVPFFCLIDLVAIGYSSDTGNKYMWKNVNGYNMKANLASLSGGTQITQTVNWAYDVEKADSISAKFIVASKDGNGNYTHMCWSGVGKFRLTNRSLNSRLYIDAAYGHTTIQIVPTYSVNFNGVTAGIKFGIGMDEQHNCGYYYTNFKVDSGYNYIGNVYGL